MKSARVAPFFLLLVAGTGCLQPAQTRLAQSTRLEDSIRFTELTASGNLVTLKISRVGDGLVTARASDVEAADFPEYVTFTKSASGSLTPVASQTRLSLPLSEAKCTDSACTSMTYTITRAGGTLGDRATLKSTRIGKTTCDVSIRDVNGVYIDSRPIFESATLTTVMEAGNEGAQSGFYGKVTYTLPNGYLANVAIRSFLGAPSELWIDQIESATQANGQLARVSTSVRTFAVETVTAGSNALSILGSDADGRHAQIGCTF